MFQQPTCDRYLGVDFPHWDAKLMDGSSVLIRPIGTQDAEAELAFIEGLSAESRRNRFLGQIAHPSAELIHQFTDVDYVNDVALVAIAENDGRRIVGVSRYAVDQTRTACECAVVVADAWQGKGLGTVLMQCLMQIASERGLLSMKSVDLAENWEMRNLASALGFSSEPDPDDSCQVIHTFSLLPPTSSPAGRPDTATSCNTPTDGATLAKDGTMEAASALASTPQPLR